ncbi:MAG TPA: aminotransferase class V-fold PLP-dependent enzyme [Candidatus Limnocylindrales bacterium]|nr:aminotransferase class V-fold PLP-dependent enzyme [Candidatus Limnocylindrales bacterium]
MTPTQHQGSHDQAAGTSAPGEDPARIDGLTEAIERLLPALEAFTRFEGPDAAARRSSWLPALDRPLPRRGEGIDAVLDDIADLVVPNGLRIGHPGFVGWITTSPTTLGTAAQLAATVAAAQRWWVTPGSFIEALALRWLVELLGLPSTSAGVFVSGGAVANLIALGAARQHAGVRLGVDLARDGVAALPEPRVYASTEVHHVALRGMAILGLGRRNLRMVPLDARRRADLDTLRRWLDEDVAAGRTPVAVVANAGDVNTGVVDPIDEMRAIAHEHGVWLHVDGAYGGFGVLDERVRPLYGDLAAVDSFAVDPHKWLAAPVGTGAVFVRDASVLGGAFTPEPADYVDYQQPTIEATDVGSPFHQIGWGTPDHTVEFSTPARGVAVWAILREIGAEGLRARINKDLDLARHVADRVRASDELELMAEPVLSICCFRYRPPGVDEPATLDPLNERILLEVQARGRVVPSMTRIGGRYVIRACFINPRSGLADADALVDEVLTVGRALTADGGQTREAAPSSDGR